MKVLELYSGIGGMHYAFKESTVDGTVVASVDINTIANKVYTHNFPDTKNLNCNIQSITKEQISKLDINCILMSPPCQPFTRVGLKKDASDNRCFSLLYLLQLIPSIETLKYILLENVKGFECSEARKEVISCLIKSNFNYKEFILSPCQFGIPNSRHRYYLIAKKKGLNFIFEEPSLSTSIPPEILDLIPIKSEALLPKRILNFKKEEKCFQIKEILQDNVNLEYLIPKNILVKHSNVLDIRYPESRGSCCFTKAYSRYMIGTGSVFSPFSESEVKVKFQEFNESTETMDTKIEKIIGIKIRYFTPKEISRLMCFPENFAFPNDVSVKQKYRLLGNSINVYVVSQLIYLLHYDKTKC